MLSVLFVRDTPNFHPLSNMLATKAPAEIDGNEARYRLWAMLFGLATVAIAGYAVRAETSSNSAGLMAAALCGVNPILIFYSQTARAYSMQQFLAVALCLWIFSDRLRTKRYGIWLAGLTILTVLVRLWMINWTRSLAAG